MKYYTAQNEYDKAVKEYDTLLATLDDYYEVSDAMQEIYEKYYNEHPNYTQGALFKLLDNDSEYQSLNAKLLSIEEEVDVYGTEQALRKLDNDINGEDGFKKQLEDAEDAYYGHLQKIQQYSDLNTAILDNDVEAMNEAIGTITHDFKTADNASKRELEEQISNNEAILDELEELSDNGHDISEDSIEDTKDFVSRSKAELAKFNLNEVKGEFKSAKGMTASELSELRKKASSNLTELKTLYDEKSPYVTQSMIDEVTRMIGGIDTQLKAGNAKAENNGKNLPSDYASGISSNKEQAIAAADNVKTASENALKSTNATKIGEDFIDGYLDGIYIALENGGVGAAAAATASMSVAAMQEALESHSPTLSSSVILAAQQATRSTAQRAASSVTTTNIHNITNNAYQQTQQTSGDRYVQESIISFERGVNDLVDFLAPKIETRTRRVGRKAVAKLG